ncbi:MAG: DUF5320 domain-containing protein [Candidatus Poribacteria bacterium]
MPFGDGTGPMGMGPMTGRAMGYCAGFPTPGYMNPGFGRGWFGFGRGWFGFGRGRGRGWRHWYYATGMPGWMRAGYGMPAFGMPVPPMYPHPVYPPQAPTPEAEIDMLRNQAEFFKKQLDEIQKRIDELESNKAR